MGARFWARNVALYSIDSKSISRLKRSLIKYHKYLTGGNTSTNPPLLQVVTVFPGLLVQEIQYFILHKSNATKCLKMITTGVGFYTNNVSLSLQNEFNVGPDELPLENVDDWSRFNHFISYHNARISAQRNQMLENDNDWNGFYTNNISLSLQNELNVGPNGLSLENVDESGIAAGPPYRHRLIQ
jgi:hypothetical protein